MPKMIQLSRPAAELGGDERVFSVNPAHVVAVSISTDYDTVLTLSTGQKVVVDQGFDAVIELIEAD